jgi:hypothetical protein
MEGNKARDQTSTYEGRIPLDLGEKQQFREGISEGFDLEAIQELVVSIIFEQEFKTMQRDLEVEFNEILMIFLNLLPATLLIASGKFSFLLAFDSCTCDVLVILQERFKDIPKEGIEQTLKAFREKAEDLRHCKFPQVEW